MEESVLDLKTVDTDNKELIHDMSYDWFGKSLAVVTAERKIKIYQQDSNKEWRKVSEFQGHNGPIWKVKWAHPDFGTIIATCSYDKSIIIWEQLESVTMDKEGKEVKTTRWIRKLNLPSVTSDSVEDIKFSPKHKGLFLAAAYADGYLRIYEILNSLTSTSSRTVLEVQISDSPLTSITWNKNHFDPLMFIVGIGPRPLNSMNFMEREMNYSPSNSEKQTPKREHRGSLGQTSFERNPASSISNKNSANTFTHHVDMSKETAKKQQDNCMLLWVKHEKGDWENKEGFSFNRYIHKNGVTDISWASLNARTYHTVVSCGRDGVIVWRFRFKTPDIGAIPEIDYVDAKCFSLYNSIPVRASWNFMATVIVVVNNDSSIYVWKRIRNGEWDKVSEIKYTENKKTISIKS